MARISLVEQYDNKDVIQQIYALKDGFETTQEQAENAESTANQAMSRIDTVMTTADQAIRTANAADTNASDALAQVTQAQTDATQALADAEQAQTDADNAIVSGSIATTTTTGSLVLTRGTGSSVTTAIPIASASRTGLMNAQTYAGITNIDARVSALEGKSTTVYVTFPDSDPDQATITSVFTTKAGRDPVAGDYATDIAKNLTYGYDGTTWTKVGTDVSISQFSLGTPGLIVGSDEDGAVFAETDGTGSVKGWDTLTAQVTTIDEQVQTMDTSLALKQDALIGVAVSLPLTAWSSVDNTATVDVGGVTVASILWVAPDADSQSVYTSSQILATGQGEGTITFEANTLPDSDLTINVVIA